MTYSYFDIIIIYFFLNINHMKNLFLEMTKEPKEINIFFFIIYYYQNLTEKLRY